MNNKVSIILRVLAIALSAGAIALFFLIKGEMEYAVEKTKPLAQVAKTSEEPFDFEYKKLAKPIDLRTSVAIVSPVCKEVEGRREQKRLDDATIAQQKSTIATRDATIDGLNADIDAKNTEIADLTRSRDELEGQKSQLEAKLAATEANLRAEKETTARLNQNIANMKTLEEYNAKVDEIEELTKKMENGQNRYTKFRHYAKAKGISFSDEEYPSALYATTGLTGPVVQFADPYVATTVHSVDPRRGLMFLSVGTAEPFIAVGRYYDLEVNGVKVGKIQISEATPSNAVVNILANSDLSAISAGTYVHLIPLR